MTRASTKHPGSSTDVAVRDDGTGGRPQRTAIPGPVLLRDLARNAWRLYRGSAAALIGIFFTAGVIDAAIGVGASQALSPIDLPSGPSVLIVYLLFIGVPTILGSFAVGVSAVLLTDRLAGVPRSVGEATRIAAQRLGSIVLAGLVATVLATFCLFVLPPFIGSFVMVPFFLGPPVVAQAIVLEQRRLGDAWERAKVLLKGHWGRLLPYLLTIALGIGLVNLVVVGSVGSAVGGLSAAIWVVVLVQRLVATLTLPYIACADLVAYFDVRARHEKFDANALVKERAGA